MLRPFMRRLLEVLFDGKAEAAEDVTGNAARYRTNQAAGRKRLVVPADPALVGQLAPHYRSKELGDIDVVKDASGVKFDFGEWASHVASHKNEDGTVSFITIDPGVNGYEFVVTDRGGVRGLVIRDGQHQYGFSEAPETHVAR
jgi:hypothetical protein